MPEVWVMAGPDANHFRRHHRRVRPKIAALRAHESQTAHMDDLEDRMRGWMGMTAQQAACPGRLAEAFMVVSTA